jgi:hypothetical protein
MSFVHWIAIMKNQQNRHPGKEPQGRNPQQQQQQQQMEPQQRTRAASSRNSARRSIRSSADCDRGQSPRGSDLLTDRGRIPQRGL